jgi:hypothetical protein
MRLSSESSMSQPTEQTVVNPYAPAAATEMPQPAALAVPLDGEIREQFQRGKNGAGWFYWIAALSLINSLMVLSGSDTSFALGLGTTLISDGLAVAFAKEEGASQAILVGAAVFDAVVLGLVVLCGWLSQKRVLPIFALGMGLYLLDGLLCLLLGSMVCIAIHGFALWCMWSGFMAFRQLNALERQLGIAAPSGVV